MSEQEITNVFSPPEEPKKRIVRNKYVVSILSLIVPGLGQVYIGRVRRGAAFFFIPQVIFGSVAFILYLFSTVLTINPLDTSTGIGFVMTFVVIVTWFIVPLSWIASIKDAYDIAC